MLEEGQVVLGRELELLFEHIEGHITLEEYHENLQLLELENEELLRRDGMLSE